MENKRRRKKKKSGCLTGVIVAIAAIALFCVLLFTTNWFNGLKFKVLSLFYPQTYSEEVQASAKEFSVDDPSISDTAPISCLICWSSTATCRPRLPPITPAPPTSTDGCPTAPIQTTKKPLTIFPMTKPETMSRRSPTSGKSTKTYTADNAVDNRKRLIYNNLSQ